ncbi:MAG TPA: ABC transporter permease [Candidatus Sulfotelmatobacter sp.]|nr:ABC transporter permease [Candidatus Sulfotelmatobacter sp.]
MTGILQDLRYALRQLRKNLSFTTIAVLTLALGIGANTAIFTVVNALMLKMLPVRDPQQLVIIGDQSKPNSTSSGTPRTDVLSYPLYKQLRDRNSVFTGMSAAASNDRIELEAGSGSTVKERVSGRMVSGNYFTVLGLEPAAGRLFSDSDDTAENANPVVVLSYQYWQRKFNLSASIIGQSVRLNGYPFTVVGVAPEGFRGDVVGESKDLFVPLSMQPEIILGRNWRNSPTVSWLAVTGRLKSGITIAQAQANLNTVFPQAVEGDYGASLPADYRNMLRTERPTIPVSPGGAGFSDLRSDYRTPLFLLMGIVGLVLLIACANVANLLLARASMRNREFAVRLAIGASRHRVLRQLLTESLLLALLGGMAGSILAIWGVRLMVNTFASGYVLPLSPDVRVLAFTLAVCVFTGVLFGLFPALRTLHVSVSPALKDTTRTTTDARSRFAWGKTLIAGQVALSLLVLFAACLLVRSLQKLVTQDLGYNRDHVVIAAIDAAGGGYKGEKMKLLAEQLISRIAGTPGVNSVTYSGNGLFSGTESSDRIIVPGFVATKRDDTSTYEDFVGPDYFSVVGIPILEGRGVGVQDNPSAAPVAILNQAMVQRFFHGQNPIGRQFRIDDPDWINRPITVVGICRNAKDNSERLREEVSPRMYLPLQQLPDPYRIVIEARVSGASSVALASIRDQIKAFDPNLRVVVRTLDSLVTDSAASQFSLAKLSAFFAGLALLLACIGLYGVMSYTVAGRTREIGVRMALGARRNDVLRLVLREGMLVVTVGLAIGIPASLASGRLLQSFLFGLKSSDPLSLTTVVLLLAVVAALAGFIPARRAAKVDPMVALRYE